VLTKAALRQGAKRVVLKVPPFRRLYEKRHERIQAEQHAHRRTPPPKMAKAFAPRFIGTDQGAASRPIPPPNEVLFRVGVRDLGQIENPRFSGILIPEPEIGAKREGIDSTFLDDAEDYYERFQGFEYWRMLIDAASRRVGIAAPELVVEFGSGFGNSTLPMLDLFRRAHVIATDLSPNLLAILRRLLDAHDVADRCTVVAMDAHRDYIRPASADLVVGSAILHHLADPGLFIERAMAVLKPGGCAIFFEPMEAGHAILRLILLAVAAEAKRRRDKSPGVRWLETWRTALEPQLYRDRLSGWRERNDKWVFPRSVLDEIGRRAGAREFIVYPLHDNDRQFSRSAKYALKTYGGFEPDAIPTWAWQIFDEFDRTHFSPELLTDFALEACIIYRK
jgi:SAM-dependent methyltransferase